MAQAKFCFFFFNFFFSLHFFRNLPDEKERVVNNGRVSAAGLV